MSPQVVRPIHHSLATLIAWISTCLLASGISMLFSDSIRTLWMWWGCFGLVAAVGLEATARIKERRREQRVDKSVQKRFERELQSAATETETIAALRNAVDRVVPGSQRLLSDDKSRRTSDRHASDLDVELLLREDDCDNVDGSAVSKVVARLNNISHHGFALTATNPLPPQQIVLLITPRDGARINLLGEIRWSESQPDGSTMSGGRLIRVLSDDDE
jgi:hypothetical protein